MNFRLILFCFFSLFISLSIIAQSSHNDTLIVSTVDSSDLKIFEKVDIEASFPGGDQEWKKFLEHNLRGDIAAENGAPSGRYTVWVQFIVDKQGNITDVRSLTNNGYGMEQEVERIIKAGPQWQPASQNGRVVKAYRKQPVTFIIEDNSFEIKTDEPYVLYTGINNSVNISAGNIKPKNIEVRISQGSIIPKDEDGNYIVRVPKPGRVVIELFDKKHKNIGAASFEVKSKSHSAVSPTLK